MSHDEHFLSRLERLEREHAEIALGLYYDSALVEHILGVANIPAEVERVALSLDDPEQGPFIIVARDGHFVTCLAEGMRLREDQVVISRHRLDTISESVESLRSLVADARAGGRSQTRRKLERVYRAGPGLSQEEFEELAPWLPLLAVDLLRSHVDTIELCHALFDRLSRYKKIHRRREQELLHEYWRSTWAAAHLTMLLGSDGGATLRKLFDKLEPGYPGTALTLPWTLIRLGVTSFALRGAWAGSKLPTFVVPVAKHRYASDESSFLTTMTDALCLSAAGLRHRRYQAEVRKAVGKLDPTTEGTRDLKNAVRGLCAAYFDQHTSDPQVHLDHTNSISRRFMRAAYETLPDFDLDLLDELPDQIPAALFLHTPLCFHGQTDAIRMLFEWLPWIVSVEAKDFYLPEPFIKMLRNPWEIDEGLALLDARREGTPRPRPVVAGPKIGRNAPCPCGSGKKYKRCCGAPGKV